MATVCKRGEIYWVNWHPGRGREQTGRRPALIIQNDIGNQYSPTTIIAACSTAQTKDYPFVVNVGSKESGLPKGCSVNLAQIITIDKSRLAIKCGALSPNKMNEIDQAIKCSLGLSLL
ncbi:MAG: type II toxin-antitoxin system PemK/MazF family toxin [Dehalococcoidia bacterium]|jgi:mRNA interferase MazF